MVDPIRALDRLGEPDVVELRASLLHNMGYDYPDNSLSPHTIRAHIRRQLVEKLVDELIKTDLIEFRESIQSTPMGSSILTDAKLKVKSTYHKIKFIY